MKTAYTARDELKNSWKDTTNLAEKLMGASSSKKTTQKKRRSLGPMDLDQPEGSGEGEQDAPSDQMCGGQDKALCMAWTKVMDAKLESADNESNMLDLEQGTKNSDAKCIEQFMQDAEQNHSFGTMLIDMNHCKEEGKGDTRTNLEQSQIKRKNLRLNEKKAYKEWNNAYRSTCSKKK